MPEGPPAPRSAADLVAELRAYGMSVAEIAHELQRSPRMVHKIVRGESSGRLYVPTLTELVETGQARSRPPRRRGRDGQPVRVRAPRGAAAPTRVPDVEDEQPAPAGTGPAASPGAGRSAGGRSRFSDSTAYLPGGVRQHTVTGPRSEGPGRERARQRLMDVLRGAARGQRHGRRNVRFRVTLRDGTSVEVGSKGGYSVSAALARSRGEGDDPLRWLREEIAERSYVQAQLRAKQLDIVGVEATIF